MPVLSEANTLGDVLKYEAPNLYSREAVTVFAGNGAARSLAVGEVIGKRTKSSAAVTPDAGNTGDGVATLADPALGASAEVGTYTLTCSAAAANGGTFQVVSPSGYVLPDLAVGQAYAGDHIHLTIIDGAADFIVGDAFTVEVTGDDKVVALDPAAVDGAHEAHGIIAADVTAPDGADTDGLAIVRDAVLADHALVWPDGITDAQKTAAIARLEARGILVRAGA